MGRSIFNLKNTLKITEECADDLYKLDIGVFDDRSDVSYDGLLYFNQEHMEHMDYLWQANVQEVLSNHKASGVVMFGCLEDPDKMFWGYDFENGEMTHLKGEVEWTYEQ